jgi:hypothetical protein
MNSAALKPTARHREQRTKGQRLMRVSRVGGEGVRPYRELEPTASAVLALRQFLENPNSDT